MARKHFQLKVLSTPPKNMHLTLYKQSINSNLPKLYLDASITEQQCLNHSATYISNEQTYGETNKSRQYTVSQLSGSISTTNNPKRKFISWEIFRSGISIEPSSLTRLSTKACQKAFLRIRFQVTFLALWTEKSSWNRRNPFFG